MKKCNIFWFFKILHYTFFWDKNRQQQSPALIHCPEKKNPTHTHTHTEGGEEQQHQQQQQQQQQHQRMSWKRWGQVSHRHFVIGTKPRKSWPSSKKASCLSILTAQARKERVAREEACKNPSSPPPPSLGVLGLSENYVKGFFCLPSPPFSSQARRGLSLSLSSLSLSLSLSLSSLLSFSSLSPPSPGYLFWRRQE